MEPVMIEVEAGVCLFGHREDGEGWGGSQAEHGTNEGTVEFLRAAVVHGRESTYQSPDVKETKTAPLCR